MPYDPSSPPAKTKKLSAAKRRQWVAVFNSCWAEHADEGKCHAMAWGVANKSLTPELLKDYVKCCVGEVSPAVTNLIKFSGGLRS